MSEHVLVTGGSSGIGRAVLVALRAEGVRCSSLDWKASVPESPVADGAGAGETASELCDITDAQALRVAFSSAEERFGPVDGVVHAAGVLVAGALLDDSLSEEDFARAVDVNLKGTWLVGREAGRRMRERGRGSLVLVTSNAATTPRVGMGAYCVSKAGAQMVMHCLALELGRYGVRVNSVSPGSTETPMLKALLGEEFAAAAVAGSAANYRLGIPLGRVGRPQDVAEAALFLLSDKSRQITGCDLRVDGGATWS